MSGLPEIVLLIATEHESPQSGPTGPHRECLAQVQVLSATFAHPKKPDQPRGPHPRGRQKSADRAELSILPKKDVHNGRSREALQKTNKNAFTW